MLCQITLYLYGLQADSNVFRGALGEIREKPIEIKGKEARNTLSNIGYLCCLAYALPL
jgi:hypothetical protein